MNCGPVPKGWKHGSPPRHRGKNPPARLAELSPTARLQVSALRLHYETLERPAAIRNLMAAIADAASRIDKAPDRGLASPRPYPGLRRPGWRWLKAGPYWFANIEGESGAVITGIFHESADIPNRIDPV